MECDKLMSCSWQSSDRMSWYRINYSATFTVIVFPLGSSNLSIVVIFDTKVMPNVKIDSKIIITKMADNIGMVKKPMQSLG